MKISTSLSVRRLVLAALAAGLLAAAPGRAHAKFVFTLTQTSGNVVVNGVGTINTAALTSPFGLSAAAQINASTAVLLAGPASNTSYTDYNGGGLTGPASFGTGGVFFASAGTGSDVGISGNAGYLIVPLGYVSGTQLTDSATFTSQTFASIGFTPGTYTYTWGTGATADSLIVTSVVPEPSTWALLGLGVAGLVFTLRRRSRAQLAA